MKKSAHLLILLLIVFACNKEQNVLDDINGSWKIKSFSLTDNEGIRHEGNAKGELTINSSSETYSTNVTYETTILSDSFNYSGHFKLIKNNESLKLTYIKPTTEIYTFEFKLIYASKDYLKIEYWDESYRLNTLLYSR